MHAILEGYHASEVLGIEVLMKTVTKGLLQPYEGHKQKTFVHCRFL